MNRCIWKEMDKRFAEMCQDQRSPYSTTKRVKSVIALQLALEVYLADNHENISKTDRMYDFLARYATYQICHFLFAGNDTTSSSVAFVYHMLATHPEALIHLRQEHNLFLILIFPPWRSPRNPNRHS
ncbi:hypothetical protein BJX70DRAFT_380071 [Aspergillus crustosus]